MAYLPSHQELASHPKTRKAARRAGVSIPTMIGHLHLLWWWALDLAPDGDLGKYDDEDLADAALWEGDPEVFVDALRNCGSGGGAGFLHEDGKLHDWAEYGGKYGKRVQAARKAAAARWQSEGNADAEQTQSEGNADGMRSHSDGNASGNAEERREEKNPPGGDGKPPFVSRLADELREQGWTWNPPANATAHEKYKALLCAAVERKPQSEHRKVTMGLIGDFVARTGKPLTKEEREHTASLASRYAAVRLFDAWNQAADWGAGIGRKYDDDPRARSKYVTAVLTGKAKP